jgi:uncharacterized membrane protein YccC
MPLMFAIGQEVIGDPTVGTFAAFGSFAMLLMVDFPGPLPARVADQAWLALTGALLVALGTLASSATWLAAVAMTVVAFGVLFAGVVSSVLAGATSALLIAFILPVSLAAPASDIPLRLAGWGLASAAALFAVALLWPAPARDPVRGAAIEGCRALAARLRDGDDDAAADRADDAVATLRDTFFATPYRPTGLSTAGRAVVRLVDELRWLNTIVDTSAPSDPAANAVLAAAADALDRGADLLDAPRAGTGPLRAATEALHARLADLERTATLRAPVSALDPGFRAQELSYVVLQIAANVEFAAAAEQRSWVAQLLGRRPEPVPGRLSAAQERASSHLQRNSVWLQNSVRGAVGLGAAVLIANATGVQHSFWVVLGTLSVLRSNALNTGQSLLRGLLGTIAGFVAGSVLVLLIGTNTAVLWALLPLAVLFAGLAPAAIGFAAGQAAFTLTLLILFNILAPEGWEIGLVRVEDVALGGAVSLAVGLLLWPRGAGAALGRALEAAYADSASYLAGAIRFGLGRCDRTAAPVPEPAAEAARAAAASRRLDDTFRNYVAERGRKPAPLAEVTSLMTGVVGLRLAGDAVLELWRREAVADGDRRAAREQLLAGAERMTGWYEAFAASLGGNGAVPAAQDADPEEERRLVAAVDHDLRGADGRATDTAVRMIWTGDHLDAARRLQSTLAGPAEGFTG